MRNILILSLLLFSCNNTIDDKIVFKTVTEIDYTFDSGWKEAYSVKINADGKCVIGDGRWDIKYYVGQLSSINIQSLDSLIESIPFKNYDSTYIEDVVDQSSYKFFITNVNKDTTIKFIYGRTAPKLLNDLSNRLRKIKEELKLTEKDTVVDFSSRNKFFPTIIKAP